MPRHDAQPPAGREPRHEPALQREHKCVPRLHVQQRAGYEAHQELVLQRAHKRLHRHDSQQLVGREGGRAPRHDVQQLAGRGYHHELVLRRDRERAPSSQAQQRADYETHQKPVLRRERERLPLHDIQQRAGCEAHHKLVPRRELEIAPRHDAQQLCPATSWSRAAPRARTSTSSLFDVSTSVCRVYSSATSWLRVSPRARTSTSARAYASSRCPATSWPRVSTQSRPSTCARARASPHESSNELATNLAASAYCDESADKRLTSMSSYELTESCSPRGANTDPCSLRDLSRGKRGTTHRSHSCVVQTRPLIPHNAASHASRSGGNRGMYGPCSHTAKNDATGRLPNPPLASTAIRLPRGESGGLPSPYRIDKSTRTKSVTR